MRSSQDIEQALQCHGASVWRACAVYFGCEADIEDAYQETFLRYALADGQEFRDAEHKKAWLLRVAANRCKDMLKARHRSNASLDEPEAPAVQAPERPETHPGSLTSDMIATLRAMDDPPRTPLYLAVCEGYPAKDIATMMNAPVNTVYSWIARGRRKLREVLA